MPSCKPMEPILLAGDPNIDLRLLDIFSVVMAGVNIHAETIKMADGECFNYLVTNESNGQYTLYLHHVSKHQSGYKTKITPDHIDSIAQESKLTTAWVVDMLFRKDGSDVIWQVESQTAKLKWMKNLNGVKFRLGTVQLEECIDAAAEMLSMCASALLDQKSRSEQLQGETNRLKEECAQLRRIAEEAVTARQEIEDHLLAKFAALLNEKKAKIRALQELIAERVEHDLHTTPSKDGAAARTAAETPSPARAVQSASAVPGAAAAKARRAPAKARRAAAAHLVSDGDDPEEGENLAARRSEAAGSGDDAYDQDTDVEERVEDDVGENGRGSDEDAAYEQDTQVDPAPPPAGRAAAERQLSQETDDSLELHSVRLDDSLIAPPKRVSTPPERPPEQPAKRRQLTDSDDLSDIV